MLKPFLHHQSGKANTRLAQPAPEPSLGSPAKCPVTGFATLFLSFFLLDLVCLHAAVMSLHERIVKQHEKIVKVPDLLSGLTFCCPDSLTENGQT